jgi:CHAT domain-containing protein
LRSAQLWLRNSSNADLLNYAGEKLNVESLDAVCRRTLRRTLEGENKFDKPYAHIYHWGAFYATGQ